MKIIAQITGTHGIKGEIKAIPLFDELNLLDSIEEIQIDGVRYPIQSHRFHKNLLLIKLKGVDSINEAELLSGYIEANIEEDLKPNQFYIEDLKGLKVISNQQTIGIVKDISSNGQTLLIIDLEDIFLPKRELLLPFVEEYIHRVSLEDSLIEVEINDEIMDLASE